jgi:hypothetical protein
VRAGSPSTMSSRNGPRAWKAVPVEPGLERLQLSVEAPIAFDGPVAGPREHREGVVQGREVAGAVELVGDGRHGWSLSSGDGRSPNEDRAGESGARPPGPAA